MERSATAHFELSGWRVAPAEGRITRGKKSVHLEPRVMDLLLCLLRHAGQVVPRSVLVDEVWQGRVVGDEAIARAISELRKAFGDTAARQRLIRTISKRGYELLVDAPLGTPAAGRGPRRVRALLVSLLMSALLLAWFPRASVKRHDGVDHAPVAVAVLPFVNQTGDAKLNFLSYGLAYALRRSFRGVQGVRVLGWQTSAALLAGKAHRYGGNPAIDQVIEGVVSGNGPHLTLVVHTWSVEGVGAVAASIDTAPDSLQQGLHSLAGQVLAELIPGDQSAADEAGRAGTRRTPSNAAWMASLRGLYGLQQGDAVSLGQALRWFQRALRSDPNDATALLGAARAHALLAEASSDSVADHGGTDVDRAAASRLYGQVLMQNPQSVGARIALLKFEPSPGSWSVYEDQLRQLIAQDPACEICRQRLFQFLQRVGKFSVALRLCEKQLPRDPLNAGLNAAASWIAYRAGDFIKGVRYARRLEALAEPSSSDARLLHAEHYWMTGEQEEYGTQVSHALQRYGLSDEDIQTVLEAIRVSTHRERAVAHLRGADLSPVARSYLLFKLGASYPVLRRRTRTVIVGSSRRIQGLPLAPKQRNAPALISAFETIGLLDYWRTRGGPDFCAYSPHEALCVAIGRPARIQSNS